MRRARLRDTLGGMLMSFTHRALRTRAIRLPDGRRVTVRHPVPSDAPRLATLLDYEPSPSDLIAMDDHGAIVGRAAAGGGTAIADAWAASELATALERELAGDLIAPADFSR